MKEVRLKNRKDDVGVCTFMMSLPVLVNDLHFHPDNPLYTVC